MNDMAFLRTTAGAPLTVLVAFLLPSSRDRGLGHRDLTRMTGYTPKTLIAALDVLAGLSFVARHARYRGWAATAQGRRMLVEIAAGLGNEVEEFHLPLLLSSSLYGENELPPLETTTTTTGSGVEKFHLAESQAVRDLVGMLTRQLVPLKRARQVIAAALARGDEPDALQETIDLWIAFCSSVASDGIKFPGAFIASRVETGTPCPFDWQSMPAARDSEVDPYRLRRGKYADYYEH